MSWADCGTDSQGRPIGYAHRGTCDEPGCNVGIDRGLSYACGGMHGADEFSCEGYFCHHHRVLVDNRNTDTISGELCRPCARRYAARIRARDSRGRFLPAVA